MQLHGGGKYSDWEIERGLQQEEIMALKMQLQERLDLAEVDASVRDRLEHELRDALQESQRIQSQLEVIPTIIFVSCLQKILKNISKRINECGHSIDWWDHCRTHK